METSERQLLRACLRLACCIAHVVVSVTGGFVVYVLSDFRTPPRMMSLALSFDLGRARDSTFSVHGFCVCQVSKLIHFQLVRDILGRVNDSSIVFALSLVSLVTHVSENPRALSLHLWATPSGMSNRTCSQREVC